MADYRKLAVWRKAHALSLNAQRAAARIRGSQYASFRSQIIRAAMSVPTNIVEGREQKTDAAFGRYLRSAIASSSELEYHVTSARDNRTISKSEYLSLAAQISEVRRMLHGLIRSLDPGS